MSRSVSSVVSSHWRLSWLLAALLCVIELKPAMAIIRYASINAVERTGSTRISVTPATELIEQRTTCWEAIAPAEADAGSWLPVSTALLPQLNWELTNALIWPICLDWRGEVLPVLFRQRQFLVAVLPNAP
ncbi:hypothetical protein [Hymenobacter norwichensis]|uniref:hypothetical protein n=1 Tax=Hymenobacter norwichensis TaxID=223903 RepID=UPI00041A287F|nr:hypothetical protein [Hymenobacter norwichensis]